MRIFRFLIACTILGAMSLSAQEPLINKYSSPSKNLSEINVSFARYTLQGYNLRCWISNQMTLGLQASDNSSSSCYHLGVEFPLGNCVEHLYGAGPYVGAIVNGRYLVDEGYNGYDASKEILPVYGRYLREKIWRTSIGSSAYDENGYYGYYYSKGIIVNRKGIDDDSDGKIDEDDLNGIDDDGDWNPATDDVGSDGLPDSIEVSCDGRPYDPVLNPDPAGDNYDPEVPDICHPDWYGHFPLKNNRDEWTEKNNLADHGEPNVDEDYGAMSHNDLYCSATDTFSTPIISRHVPMGAKVIQKSYAWEYGSAADAIIFFEYKFINLSADQWQDAYVGFFGDMDIGPPGVSNFSTRNYSAYDSVTKTAYVHNPIDEGSTPLGITLLGLSKPQDSLRLIFQWFDFTTRYGPATNDSLIYQWMSGNAFPDQLIYPDQTTLSDTRFLLCSGPFQVGEYDTVTAIYAMVSGLTIEEMLNNARKAHRIHESNGFIMPNPRMSDEGSRGNITISWDPFELSPYGQITSYHVFYGKESGVYTDSITTTDLSVTITSEPGNEYFFTMVAFDDKGNRSAISDEINTTPYIPTGLAVTGYQTFISLQWNSNDDPDLAGYNIYRRVSGDSLLVIISDVLSSDTTLHDTTVRGDKIYYYKISAVDRDGHESRCTLERQGRLIPPAIPTHFIVIKRPDTYYLTWSPNGEFDLAGYNIYRSEDGSSTNLVKLNSNIWTLNEYTDSIINPDQSYYYCIEAVDTTDAVSERTAIRDGYYIRGGKGIWVYDVNPESYSSTTREFYGKLLIRYKYSFYMSHSIPNPCGYLGYLPYDYSTALILFEYFGEPFENNYSYDCYPLGLKRFLLAGGKLLIMGRKFTTLNYPHYARFLSEYFGINQIIELSDKFNFSGAVGSFGFPSVGVDTNKLVSSGGRINYVERLSGILPQNTIYTYLSDPYDSLMEGKPVGIKALNPDIKAYYLSFPLYYLDSASAAALISAILSDFGEEVTVVHNDAEVPIDYRLYDAYPNPFNPAAKISFDLPYNSIVDLTVYDILGRVVANLIHAQKPPGKYELEWNAQLLSSGVYFYRLDVQSTDGLHDFSETKKLLLMR